MQLKFSFFFLLTKVSYSWPAMQCIKKTVFHGRVRRDVKLKTSSSMVKCSKIYEYSIKKYNKDYIKDSQCIAKFQKQIIKSILDIFPEYKISNVFFLMSSVLPEKHICVYNFCWFYIKKK